MHLCHCFGVTIERRSRRSFDAPLLRSFFRLTRDYKWWKLNDITFWVYPDCRVKGRRHRALTDSQEAHAVAKKMEQFV